MAGPRGSSEPCPLLACSMNAGHRVKSVSMGKYSMDEVKALEKGGNDVRLGLSWCWMMHLEHPYLPDQSVP